MANLITLSRLILLTAVIILAYQPPSAWQFAGFFLIILIFVSDGLDGYVARKRNEASLFGAMFDIAGDRVVELCLWVVAADIDLVPIWLPLVVIVRDVAVDTIRSNQAAARGVAPFALMRSPLGQMLVAGKFMRISYATVKASAFAGLWLLNPFPVALPTIWAQIDWQLTGIVYVLVYLAVLLCILRGLPVIVEFVHAQRHDIIGPRSAP